MTALINLPEDLCKLPLTHGIVDDFYFERDEFWTDTADAGTHTLDADGVGGILQLINDATDNNEQYRESPERWKIADDKPIVFECRAKFVEANTDDNNVIIGLMDAPGANTLLDNGAGPKASYSGAVFFKVDGGTKWQVESSEGSTQTTHTTEHTAGGGWQTVRIIIRPISSTEAEVEFWIDPNGGQDFQQVREDGVTPRVPNIKHTVDYSSTTELAIVMGQKNGDTNAETLEIDYVACFQKR